jgi:hypothetical protein
MPRKTSCNQGGIREKAPVNPDDLNRQGDPEMNDLATTCARPTAAGASRKSSLPAIIVAIALLAGGYIAYQRVGTRANANVIEFNPNIAGGFLAVGMTDEEPGFILLSTLHQDRVTVDAEQYENALSGTYTTLEITTPTGQTRLRLRDPEIIVIDESGEPRAFSVEWTLSDFHAVSSAVSSAVACEDHNDHAGQPVPCGQPFLAFRRFLNTGSAPSVPDELHSLLEKLYSESNQSVATAPSPSRDREGADSNPAATPSSKPY